MPKPSTFYLGIPNLVARSFKYVHYNGDDKYTDKKEVFKKNMFGAFREIFLPGDTVQLGNRKKLQQPLGESTKHPGPLDFMEDKLDKHPIRTSLWCPAIIYNLFTIRKILRFCKAQSIKKNNKKEDEKVYNTLLKLKWAAFFLTLLVAFELLFFGVLFVGRVIQFAVNCISLGLHALAEGFHALTALIAETGVNCWEGAKQSENLEGKLWYISGAIAYFVAAVCWVVSFICHLIRSVIQLLFNPLGQARSLAALAEYYTDSKVLGIAVGILSMAISIGAWVGLLLTPIGGAALLAKIVTLISAKVVSGSIITTLTPMHHIPTPHLTSYIASACNTINGVSHSSDLHLLTDSSYQFLAEALVPTTFVGVPAKLLTPQNQYTAKSKPEAKNNDDENNNFFQNLPFAQAPLVPEPEHRPQQDSINDSSAQSNEASVSSYNPSSSDLG